MRKKPVPRKEVSPAPESHGKAMNTEPSRPTKDQQIESEAIERAVYDGMQDLRAEKPK